MAAKPRIIPIGEKYHVLYAPMLYAPVKWLEVTLCGRTVWWSIETSPLSSYADPNLCKLCLRRRLKAAGGR